MLARLQQAVTMLPGRLPWQQALWLLQVHVSTLVYILALAVLCAAHD